LRAVPDAGRSARKMLIADDDLSVVRLLASRCTDMGFQVETATNGVQALVLARRNEPDVVIIDVNMPEVDGLSVCSRLLDPHKKPVEVIVITGTSDTDTVERCKSLGTYYGHKGPNFWNSISSALTRIFPDMAERINQQARTSPGAGAEMRKHPCVLVVDDDSDIATFLSDRLGRCGVDTLYASDGLQGFRVACKEVPSAIISDCFMLNGDAYYLLWRLRSAPTTKNIPVFVISGRRLDEAAERNLTRDICGRPGVARVFRKSSEINELFSALQRVCGFQKDQAAE
jgi:CheY-like chemotaxis protein